MEFINLKKLFTHLKYLKKKYALIGIKAEFEAEGSTHEDISLLRAITYKAQTKLFVKIGGVEAINDIKFLIKNNIDGIIAPMVESRFSAHKFISFFQKNNFSFRPELIINIESRTGLENLYEIYSTIKNDIDGVTIGRTDLATSYFNNNIYPNSNFITKKIIEISRIFKKSKIHLGIGGSIDKQAVKQYSENIDIKKNIFKIETRKIILPTKKFLKHKNALNDALKFEELYILMKNDLNDFQNKSDLSRLSILRTRK